MNTEIEKLQLQLAEAFPPEVERTLSKSGTRLTYIPVSEVITRLNRVLGIGNWSYRIASCQRDAIDPDFVIAHVMLEATIPTEKGSTEIWRDGIGGQKIKRTKTGEIVDLGDEMKGAVSDALKKAAQTLGVGLYLARTEEAMEIEKVEKTDPEIDQLWEQFIGLSKSLEPEKRNDLNSFWNEYSNNAPKPSKATATKSQLEALIAECIRLSFNATIVVETE